jgi:tetratricopeptide (TPR) repeat protein
MRSKSLRLVFGLLLSLAWTSWAGAADASPSGGYAGSQSCKECHERFYQLWSTSFHGLAMQPYSRDFAKAKLSAAKGETAVGKYRYMADISGKDGWINEAGPNGRKRYRIEHVLGGKNVYYFLTAMEKGRLQTLPLAYDVQKKQWFDMAGSGMRHFPGRHADAPVNWKDWPYTFNTACYSCHVSQLSTNYDPASDTYDTRWREPGINCETCHGPSEAHNRLFRDLPKGAPAPADPKIISVKTFTPAQHNDSCSTCHAKSSPLTSSYPPGERFFDHFDLMTLESPDYYPDGRDLGENYTFTSWRLSPCAQKSVLNCVSCHTSSGRYRFRAPEKANEACLPCHRDHVADPTAHTHHKADTLGNRCVSCHMPVTEFARMKRSDHSMRPPAPAATIAFKSPNACNGCHKDKSPEWADGWVRKWRARDYQAVILERGNLIKSARERDWKQLPQMLEAIAAKDRDEVLAASLIRLLRASQDTRIPKTLEAALKDPSPLVRSSAAESLGLIRTPDAVAALATATADDTRVVRVRAAQALSGFQSFQLAESAAADLKKATGEYLTAITARPDQWTSHYNLANYYLSRQEYALAVASYQTAIGFDRTEIAPWVNLSMAYARQGELGNAEAALAQALLLEPANAEANFNMALLKGERNDLREAERHLRRALKTDPQMSQAAFNLCVIMGEKRLAEAVGYCRQAAEQQPQNGRYAWTLAYFLDKNGETQSAAETLERVLSREPLLDGYLLLSDIYRRTGDRQRAISVLDRGMADPSLSQRDRALMESARKRQVGN